MISKDVEVSLRNIDCSILLSVFCSHRQLSQENNEKELN